MNRTLLIANCTILLILMFAAVAAANSIGLSYQQIIDDRSLGLTADYQTELNERLRFDAAAQVQAGDIYNARLNTDFTFDLSVVDLKLLIENKMKGYSIDALGREQSVGLAFTVPVENLNIDVGIGGKNANPFGSPNAFDSLVNNSFAESALLNKGLEQLTPAPKGIPFQNGSALNAFVATGFPIGAVEVGLKGIIELLGSGDRMHQVNTTLKTSYAVGSINLTSSIEIGLATYREEIHYELGTVTTAGIKF